MRKRAFLFTICALAMLTNTHFSPGMKAQERPKSQDGSEPEGRALIVPSPVLAPAVPLRPAIGMVGANLLFVMAERNFGRTLVKGAPFSADAVTESIQVLADGNRIVSTVSSSLYRDGEGRTRVERSRPSLGPRVENPDLYKSIMISDPVSRYNYVLQPHSQTAFKTPYVEIRTSLNNPGVASDKDRVRYRVASGGFEKRKDASDSANKTEGSGQQAIPPDRNTFNNYGVPSESVPTARIVQVAPPVPPIPNSQGWESKEEPLGKQMIEGVEAEGTRTTQTIPAGTIGNDRPIEIVSERWYSSALQVVILVKQTDPRAGETVYRLTNINRSEPDASLFQVPSNYTIQEPQFGISSPGVPTLRKKDDQ